MDPSFSPSAPSAPSSASVTTSISREDVAAAAKTVVDAVLSSSSRSPASSSSSGCTRDKTGPCSAYMSVLCPAIWFNPQRMHPNVEALVYWRDPKKSGIVFGSIMVVLLSLTFFSFISVVANLSLLALCVAFGFRIYKTVQQAIQKTSDGHPFKEILEMDLTLPVEKVKTTSELAVAHINAIVAELRRLFFVEDLIDSVKFGVALWMLTYVGSWFNGMTLIIIGVVGLFTFPKVYETNKAQIDQNVDLIKGKVNEITAKVKAAIPIGKKAEEKKEQ